MFVLGFIDRAVLAKTPTNISERPVVVGAVQGTNVYGFMKDGNNIGSIYHGGVFANAPLQNGKFECFLYVPGYGKVKIKGTNNAVDVLGDGEEYLLGEMRESGLPFDSVLLRISPVGTPFRTGAGG